MDKISYVKNAFKDHFNYLVHMINIVNNESEVDNQSRKTLLKSLINELKEDIQKSLSNKLIKGKINQEYTIFLMTWLNECVDEFNKVQVYTITNNIVEARDTRVYPKIKFYFVFDKANCKKNLELLKNFQDK